MKIFFLYFIYFCCCVNSDLNVEARWIKAHQSIRTTQRPPDFWSNLYAASNTLVAKLTQKHKLQKRSILKGSKEPSNYTLQGSYGSAQSQQYTTKPYLGSTTRKNSSTMHQPSVSNGIYGSDQPHTTKPSYQRGTKLANNSTIQPLISNGLYGSDIPHTTKPLYPSSTAHTISRTVPTYCPSITSNVATTPITKTEFQLTTPSTISTVLKSSKVPKSSITPTTAVLSKLKGTFHSGLKVSYQVKVGGWLKLFGCVLRLSRRLSSKETATMYFLLNGRKISGFRMIKSKSSKITFPNKSFIKTTITSQGYYQCMIQVNSMKSYSEKANVQFSDVTTLKFNITFKQKRRSFKRKLTYKTSKQLKELHSTVMQIMKKSGETASIQILPRMKNSIFMNILIDNQNEQSKWKRCHSPGYMEKLESRLRIHFHTNHVKGHNYDCCPNIKIGSMKFTGVYNFPISMIGKNVTRHCVYSKTINISSKCIGDLQYGAHWSRVNLKDCPAKSDSTNELIDMSKKSVCNSTSSMTKCSTPMNMSKHLNSVVKNSTVTIPEDVWLIGEILNNIVKSSNMYEEDEELHTTDNILTVVDKLMDVDESILALSQDQTNATSNILSDLDEVPKMLSSRAKNKPIIISKKNIGLSMSSLTSKDFIVRAKQVESKNVEVEFGESHHDHTYSHVLASLKLKKDAFAKDNTDLLVYSYFFKEPALFQSKSGSNKVDNILAVTITNRDTSSLHRSVELMFSKNNTTKRNVVNRQCSFWHSGEWAQTGCRKASENETTIICECDHLTNFAILLDISQEKSNPLSLQIMTWVGCTISLLGLILTIIAHLTIRTIRDKLPSRILVFLSISLCCLMCAFLVGVERSERRLMCQMAAAFIQYFTITSFFWMNVEAVNLYKSFVRIFNKGSQKRFIIVSSAFSWGTPLVIVIITAAIDPGALGNKKYCICTGFSFYFGTLLPIGISLIVNYYFLVVVIKSLMEKLKLSAQVTGKETTSQLTQAKITLACATLLGSTWIFGMFAVGDATEIFQWLFTICNSFQGFFIFVFYTLTNAEVKKVIREFCRNGKWFSLSSVGSSASTAEITTSHRINELTKPAKKVCNADEDWIGLDELLEDEHFEFVEGIVLEHDENLKTSKRTTVSDGNRN